MDYSKTVNLPKTDFPMKANLPNREPEIIKKWVEQDIYKTILESRKDCETYILHDGPPYANGHIHTGHALNKILKDIIIKHKTMMGYKVPYVPGWDCHGLPIELQVMKKLGSKAREMHKNDIRKKCREYADNFVTIQMEEFKRLGVFADYENPYKTMSPAYEAKIVEVFGEIFKKGYIYKNKKPIYWCPNCVTALAEAEVEYEDHTSTSVYVKFKVDPSSISIDGVNSDNTYVAIWTTTPWTLPANLAVCFHPRFEYKVYAFGDENYIVASGLLEQVEEAAGKKHDACFGISKDEIENLVVKHPFIDRESKVIFGDHVTLEQGTGIVHTAPGHGHEDYIIGLQNDLEIFCPVDDEGKFTDDYPEMKGEFIFKANSKIVDMLRENGQLIHSHDIEHSYPHCWRCKKPLIFRATEQWFFRIDHDNLRDKAVKSIDSTTWIPNWGESRFRSMVEGRPDWCLSRQRSWGVPIPSFRCEECGENMTSTESVEHFVQIAKEEGIDTWYAKDINELIPAGTKCACGSEKFIKESDILDVWFDSGVSHFVVLDEWEQHRWPADLYLEGSDQHRGWFQSSLWPALALRDRPPYNTVLTHGFLLDDKGKAMSKSLGNVMAPEKLINQYGADIVRLWVSSEDYRNDVRIGMDMMKQIADSYRRIRNTLKFLIGTLSDFSDDHKVSYDELSDIDKWVLHNLYTLSKEVINHYEKFEFHLVYRKILNFCAVELSSIYFDVSKDILYIEPADSKKRRANQTVLNEVYNTILHLVSPILAFTSEEVWQFTKQDGSMHTQRYYKLDDAYNNQEINTKVTHIVNLKKDFLKALEPFKKDKTFKTSLEADITVFVKSETIKQVLSDSLEGLKTFLQVASVTIVDQETPGMAQMENSSIAITKSNGEKCERCWNYYETLGSDPRHPTLCERCTDVVSKL